MAIDLKLNLDLKRLFFFYIFEKKILVLGVLLFKHLIFLAIFSLIPFYTLAINAHSIPYSGECMLESNLKDV